MCSPAIARYPWSNNSLVLCLGRVWREESERGAVSKRGGKTLHLESPLSLLSSVLLPSTVSTMSAQGPKEHCLKGSVSVSGEGAQLYIALTLSLEQSTAGQFTQFPFYTVHI